MRLARRRTLAVIGLAALLQASSSLQPAVADPAATPVTPSAEVAAPEGRTATPEPNVPEAPVQGPSAAPGAEPTPTAETGGRTGGEAGEIAAVSPAERSEPQSTSDAAAGVFIPGGRKLFVRRDVVVYGGTPAGVSAAIAAAESGARTVLVSESSTVGGLMSNGISATDIGSALAVQGLAKRFFDEIRTYYEDPRTWRFEPRVAERVLVRMLGDAGVRVVHDAPVQSVTVNDRRVRCGVFAGAVSACGDTFIDASYTGDLMAVAGAPHRLGMGDYHSYRSETLPPQREWFTLLSVAPGGAAAARAAFEDNPFVTVSEALEPYGDVYQRGTPSITYRLCVTKVQANRLPFRPSADYADLLPSFRILADRMRSEVVHRDNGTILTDAFHLAALPNGKYDMNAGRLSYTNLPTPAGYFDLDADRDVQNRRIRDYVESFFHFVGTDPSVPAPLRETLAPFGLCADEFVDNGGWPREPYVREGRRLQGRFTVTEHDIFSEREKNTSVALSSYNLDSKLSQFVFVDDTLYRDRGVHSTAPVYEIPFEAMLPDEGGLVNLLVPVGVSASPTAFGSIRMEPQWMALGEAAGVAAALAADKERAVDSVDVTSIQWVLRKRSVLHKAADICRLTPPIFRAVGGYTFYCDVLPVEPKLASKE